MTRLHAFAAIVVAALLAGCGGAQLPVGVTRQSIADLNRTLPGGGYTTLFKFNSANGAFPPGALIALNGLFYSTTYAGGSHSAGTVFSVSVSGNEKVLHNFGGQPDGANPEAGLTQLNGTLYGTTSGGGTKSYGTVFKVVTAGKEQVLYSFKGGADGHTPYSPLLAIGGTLYGTTGFGGAYCSDFGALGCGVVFKIDTSGRETVLYRFKGSPDGETSRAELIEVKGTLYGTTFAGGASDVGAVFSLSRSGKERVLYSFKGAPDGQYPFGGLLNFNGKLYGTTEEGGANGLGAVYEVTPSGKEQIIYNFKGAPDGAEPSAPLIALNGSLYGTTTIGGSSSKCGDGCGTVFTATTSGTEHALHSFSNNPDGDSPFAGLLVAGGLLYGTTDTGGYGEGTVFKLSP